VLNLHQLAILQAVRDAGSLSRAADALGYGTPTVVHHVNALEGRLGVRLVVRDRRGTRLTPLGEELVAAGSEILRRADELERVIRDHRAAGLVTMRIATFASAGSRLLPPAISRLKAALPVRIEVTEAEPTEALRLLREHRVQAALFYDIEGEDPWDLQDVETTLLRAEPYALMMAATHPLASTSPVALAGLEHESWVLSRDEGAPTTRLLRQATRRAGFAPRELIRTDDLSMIHGLVAEGLALAMATETVLDRSFDVALRPTTPSLGIRQMFFATLPGEQPAAVRRLRDLLLALTQEG